MGGRTAGALADRKCVVLVPRQHKVKFTDSGLKYFLVEFWRNNTEEKYTFCDDIWFNGGKCLEKSLDYGNGGLQ
ncbi:MAG: hypothetical protein IKO65_00055 [Victivallales bacterium]|nr:hypothetical protein [Victivallales bacterium]